MPPWLPEPGDFPIAGVRRISAADIESSSVAGNLSAISDETFDELRKLDASAIRQQRRQKFLDIGRKLG